MRYEHNFCFFMDNCWIGVLPDPDKCHKHLVKSALDQFCLIVVFRNFILHEFQKDVWLHNTSRSKVMPIGINCPKYVYFSVGLPYSLALKFYSQILCGLPKFLDFGYFVLIWWQTDKKQEILKQSCKDLFIWSKLPIVWLIIGSDNIFIVVAMGLLECMLLCTTC